MSSTDLPRGLRYSTDSARGCTRRRCGRGFAYYDPEGKHIREMDTLQRFRALAVPPAYVDVWLCVDPRGHLQATGRDARGRKQYRYHEAYRAYRESLKFTRLADFGKALGGIRRGANRVLRRSDPGEKAYACALVVKLLDATGFRVGCERYLRENRTRGMLTLTTGNLEVDNAAGRMEFDFRAKGGKRVKRQVERRHLARCVRRLRELPGQRIFVYRNGLGEWSDLCSEDVNAFLGELAGQPFSAKDFRTWIGTREAAAVLAKLDPDELGLGEAWQRAISSAAETLGNTKAVARKSYVHPALEDEKAWEYFRAAEQKGGASTRRGLSREECTLVDFLEGWGGKNA